MGTPSKFLHGSGDTVTQAWWAGLRSIDTTCWELPVPVELVKVASAGSKNIQTLTEALPVHVRHFWWLFLHPICSLTRLFSLLQGAFTCGWCIWSYAFRLMWVILLNNCQHYIHHTCVLTWGDVRVVLPGERGAWKHCWKKQCRLGSSSWTSLEPSSLRATVSVKVEWYSVHCTCQRIFTSHVLLLCWWAVYYDACAFLPLKRITWPKTNLLISHMPRMGHEQQNRVADVNYLACKVSVDDRDCQHVM